MRVGARTQPIWQLRIGTSVVAAVLIVVEAMSVSEDGSYRPLAARRVGDGLLDRSGKGALDEWLQPGPNTASDPAARRRLRYVVVHSRGQATLAVPRCRWQFQHRP